MNTQPLLPAFVDSSILTFKCLSCRTPLLFKYEEPMIKRCPKCGKPHYIKYMNPSFFISTFGGEKLKIHRTAELIEIRKTKDIKMIFFRCQVCFKHKATFKITSSSKLVCGNCKEDFLMCNSNEKFIPMNDFIPIKVHHNVVTGKMELC